MGKRDIREAQDGPAEDTEMEEELVDVDFDFFDVVDDDFLSIKHLLRQLFDVDNIKFELSTLAQLVIDSATGSTIKTDGQESDPFAVIAVVDAAKLAESGLDKYWIERTSATGDTPELNRTLRKLFSSKSQDKVGVLFSERLLNMPLEIVHPLYRFLADELAKKGIKYDYLVVPSKAYTEEESQLEPAKQPTKKGTAGAETFYFHPEDETLRQTAVVSGSYPLETKIEETDSRGAFSEHGIRPQGYISVLRFADLEKTVDSLASYALQEYPPN